MESKRETKEAYEYIVHRRKPLPFLDVIKGKIIADIGCGSGQNCIYMKKIMNKYAVCVDIAIRQLEESKKKGCEDLVQADMEFLPFRDSSIEALMYIASLHHLENPRNAIVESSRVLKKGGEIIATVWLINLSHLFRRNAFLESRIGDKTVKRFVHFYMPFELKKYMESFGNYKTIEYKLYRVKSLLPNNAFYYGIKKS
ncbi:MAG: class I SAM-dependent methyltransferase [Sulfolobaceae archaeon]|nr:class I SAM-dependent methyltransferase [Sulfolobaceae archaeon]